MSDAFSMASHCKLQNLPEVVRQVHTGCLHFSDFTVAISFLLDSDSWMYFSNRHATGV